MLSLYASEHRRLRLNPFEDFSENAVLRLPPDAASVLSEQSFVTVALLINYDNDDNGGYMTESAAHIRFD